MREILTTHNGDDSDDMINELLALSSSYVNDIDNSLQGFVAWFENNNITVKRDMEYSDKVRVMTVHGSKGLEAPIVILCDSTTLPVSSSKFIWDDKGEADLLNNEANKEEFEGNTEALATAAYTLVREDASTGLTHKLPLEVESGKMSKRPDWIKVKAPNSAEYYNTKDLIKNLRLNTVCEEAACPNIGECW